MAAIRVSRTQWQWMTQQPYTDGVFSCPDNVAAQLVARGAAQYIDSAQDDELEAMTRRELMKYAKSIGIKSSPSWKKADVLDAILKYQAAL
jgi:hypothetical protein